MSVALTPARPGPLGMTRYQWVVLLAAWLGWGFDAFDALLFNFVGPNCVPTLLGLTIGSSEAKSASAHWVGLMNSALLLSWAAGGVIFGQVADRIGRTRTLVLTILLYTAGTALCAVAPNIWALLFFRIVSGLGIGGEWAAGASMVAEVVPENRRVEAGALLYTSSPLALFLATFLNYEIAGTLFKGQPEISWRYVFLTGLLPAAVALLVRLFVREPERWQRVAGRVTSPLRELFSPEHRRATISGLVPALTVLLTWWSCYAFITVLATQLAQATALAQHLDKADTGALVEHWKAVANYSFNWGGLIGTLLTIPAAKLLGRKGAFIVYLSLATAAFLMTFGPHWAPETRLRLCVLPGLTIFGAFALFTFYLPELFPTRLRATGAGFCYNFGRTIAALGPFIVGLVAAQGLGSTITALLWLAAVPVVGLCFFPLVIETRGRTLAD